MIDATIAVLAGGRSRRMGSDKAFVRLHDRPLIDHVLERVSTLALPTIIIANEPERYQAFHLPVFSDQLPGKGSLGGVYTALYHSPTAYILCVACDMPLLNPTLLAYLLMQRRCGAAVVPLIAGRPEGLHSVYSKTCLAPLLRALEQDHLKIADFLPTVQTCYVAEPDLRRFDPQLRSFINLNTPDDLRQIEQHRA